MADLAGAVDLAELKTTLGPREAEALQRELREIAATREVALRDRAAALAENEGYSRAIAALVHVYGEQTADGKRVLTINAEQFLEAINQVVAMAQDAGSSLTFVNTYRFDGTWEITKHEPTGDERARLPVYEELPEFLLKPGHASAIVVTKKGWRIAEWSPR